MNWSFSRKDFLAEWIQTIGLSHTNIRDWKIEGAHASSSSRQFLSQWRNVCHLCKGRIHYGTLRYYILLSIVNQSIFLCSEVVISNIFVQVWNSEKYPVTMKYQHDMKSFSWKYTQFSQFNCSDTLLLVSGVHFGTPHSTSGEIAVFKVTREFNNK